METELNKIFDELQEEAYNAEYHTYDYKITNQIIRKYFGKYFGGRAETMVMPKIAEVKAYTIEEQLAMALGTIEQQKKLIKEVYQVIKEAPELNPSNYTHDEACELNNKMIEAYGILNDSNFTA